MTQAPDASAFAEMARILDAAPDVATTAEQICDMARDAIGCTYAGITLLHGRRRVESVAATDELVEKADRLQYDMNEGPCIDAIWGGDTFASQDLANEPRWPAWGPQVAEMGITGILSVRLYTYEDTHGSLNLYATEGRTFDDSDVDIAQVYAAHASVALASARETEQLKAAIDSRHLIGLAQGILMERFDISVDRSFEVLRRYSQTRNVKLREIAAEVVERRSRGLDAG